MASSSAAELPTTVCSLVMDRQREFIVEWDVELFADLPPNARAHILSTSTFVETWPALLPPAFDIFVDDDRYIRQVKNKGNDRKHRKVHKAQTKQRGKPRWNQSHSKKCAHGQNCYKKVVQFRCNNCHGEVCGAHKESCGFVECGSRKL